MEEGRGAWVYMMADRYRGAIYVGVTAHLAARGFVHGLDMAINEKAAAFARSLRGDAHA